MVEAVAAASTATRPSVLHIIPTLLGGGAERQLSYLAGETAKRGWDVYVAYLKEGMNCQRLENAGVTLIKLPANGNHDPSILWNLVRLVNRLRPSVVQTWILQMDIAG